VLLEAAGTICLRGSATRPSPDSSHKRSISTPAAARDH
jgi:hypothetical protein